MERKIYISNADLKEIQIIEKKKGNSTYKTSKMIGKNYRGSLYGGFSLGASEKELENAENIIGRKIKTLEEPIDRKNREGELIKIEKNEETAELIGIILGDGNVNIPNYTVSITFNANESKVIENALNLLTKVFGRKITIKKLKSNAVVLYLCSKYAINELLRLDIIPGNKVKHQVSVPLWIRNNESFSISCLRGLVDSDGCVYLDKSNNQICIAFRNQSLNLIRDFKFMCEKLNINLSLNNYNNITLRSKKSVKEFLEIVKPMKWLMKEENLKDKLEYKINYPQTRAHRR